MATYDTTLLDINGIDEISPRTHSRNVKMEDGRTVEVAINEKLVKTGDAKDTTVTFTEATTRENILTTDKMSVLWGKVKKFFTDLKAIAFSGHAKDATITDTNNKFTSTNVDGALDEVSQQMEQITDKVKHINIADIVADVTGDIQLDTAKGIIFGHSSIVQAKTGSYYCIVETLQYTNDYKVQKVYTFSNSLRMLERFCVANVWTEFNGVATTDKIDILSTDLRNGWSFNSTVTSITKNGNQCTINVILRDGTATVNTVIMNIPEKFRPTKAELIDVMYYNSSLNGANGLLQINTNGDVVILNQPTYTTNVVIARSYNLS